MDKLIPDWVKFSDLTSSNSSDSNNSSDDNIEITHKLAPLETDEHYHVFFHYYSSAEHSEQIEHLLQSLESENPRIKIMTTEKDFKSGLSTKHNLVLAVSLSQKVVLHVTNEFLASELRIFQSIIPNFSSKGEHDSKVALLLGSNVNLPESLLHYNHVLHLTEQHCFNKLTTFLRLQSGNILSKWKKKSKDPGPAVRPKTIQIEPKPSAPSAPSAPPAPAQAPSLPASKTSREPLRCTFAPEPSKPSACYWNGHVVETAIARDYQKFVSCKVENGSSAFTWCQKWDLCQSKGVFQYKIPRSLQTKGLQMTDEEFKEVLDSLSQSSRISFFEKAVDFTLPCITVSVIIIVTFLSWMMWFLSIATLIVSQSDVEPARDLSSTIFWSYMILIVFIPALSSLCVLAIIFHLANYKYLKYRVKIAELNKRFRDMNLVLHVRRRLWRCSGRLRLYFIHYNFEKCQQTLYCHVHDAMEINSGMRHNPAMQLDKIMKRVNTLTRKYECRYFDLVATNRLPTTEKAEHRHEGMCFCQYILHNESQAVVGKINNTLQLTPRNSTRTGYPAALSC